MENHCREGSTRTLNCLNPPDDGELSGDHDNRFSIDKENFPDLIAIDPASSSGMDHIKGS